MQKATKDVLLYNSKSQQAIINNNVAVKGYPTH